MTDFNMGVGNAHPSLFICRFIYCLCEGKHPSIFKPSSYIKIYIASEEKMVYNVLNMTIKMGVVPTEGKRNR